MDECGGLVSEVGTPIGYCRDPELWLLEWSLENMPLPLVKRDGKWYHIHDRAYAQQEQEETMSEQSNDTRTDEQKAPKKGATKVKAEKAPKAPKEPKAPWTAPARALEAVAIMKEFAARGEKKVLAYFVTEAIAARQSGKDIRDSAQEQPAETAGVEA